MTTFTITTKPAYIVGQRVSVAKRYPNHWGTGIFFTGATILRVSDHELLVRVGGKLLAFQEHEPGVWSWCQPEQGSFETGDERQGRLV